MYKTFFIDFTPLKKYEIFYHKDIKQILHKNYTEKYFEEILTENEFIWHIITPIILRYVFHNVVI